MSDHVINPNEMYTAAEAAMLLKVSTRTMRRYLRDGIIKGVQLRGYQWRVRGANLIDVDSAYFGKPTVFESAQPVPMPPPQWGWIAPGSFRSH